MVDRGALPRLTLNDAIYLRLRARIYVRVGSPRAHARA